MHSSDAGPSHDDRSTALSETYGWAMDTTEVNRATIREAFEHWEHGDSAPFFALVAADVRWTVIGTTDISGTFEGKRAFIERAAGKLTAHFDGPLTATIVDIGADGDKVYLQWKGSARSTMGLPYDQTYCWVLTFRDGKVVEAVAYLDTDLVNRVLQ